MIARGVILGLALFCSACGTTSLETRRAVFAPSIAAPEKMLLAAAPTLPPLRAQGAPAPQLREESFACVGGESLRVRFSANGERATVRLGAGRAITMRRATAEGFASYEGGGAVFRQAGPRASWAAAASVRPCRRRLMEV